jgi:general secretion pathway protein D
MKIHLRWSGIPILVALIFYLALAPAAAQTEKPPAPGQESADAQKKKSEKFVTIDFNDVEISVFIKFISELTGKNFVVDQRVRGKVTILSPKKISETEAYKVFESVLEVHGFATVKAGEIIKIVPAPDARSKSIETQIRQKELSADDRMVTQLIPLKYAEPNEIKRLLTPLVSKSAVILAYPETNTLIVTDAYSNIVRMMKILAAIDVTGIGQELSVIPLEYADASKFVKLLTTIYTPKQPKKGDTRQSVTFVADERTNSLILIASEDETKKIRDLVGMLDREIPRGTGNIRVYYLEHASAEDLAKVLMEVPSKQTSTAAPAGATGAPGARKEAPVVSGPVRVTADKATNSLIIISEKEDYLVIEEIIKKLDIPRSMVYIESLIMEVNVNKQFNLGTDWSVLAEVTHDGRRGGRRRRLQRRKRKFATDKSDRAHGTCAGNHYGIREHRHQCRNPDFAQYRRHHPGLQVRRGRAHPVHAADPDHRQRGGENHRGRKHSLPDPLHRGPVQPGIQLLRVSGRGEDSQDHPPHQQGSDGSS